MSAGAAEQFDQLRWHAASRAAHLRFTSRLNAMVAPIAAVTVGLAALASSARVNGAIFALAAFAHAKLAAWGKLRRNWILNATDALVAIIGIASLLVARQSAAASLKTVARDASRRSIGSLLNNLKGMPGLYAESIVSGCLSWLGAPLCSVVWV